MDRSLRNAPVQGKGPEVGGSIDGMQYVKDAEALLLNRQGISFSSQGEEALQKLYAPCGGENPKPLCSERREKRSAGERQEKTPFVLKNVVRES